MNKGMFNLITRLETHRKQDLRAKLENSVEVVVFVILVVLVLLLVVFI